MSRRTTLPPEKDPRTVLGFMVAEREERERAEKEGRKREVEANSRIKNQEELQQKLRQHQRKNRPAA